MSSQKGRDLEEEIEKLRAKIDDIDEKVLKLLNRRASIVRKVGDAKSRLEAGKPSRTALYRPDRERLILGHLKEINPGPFPSQSIAPVFMEIISACRSLEIGLQVAYLGPEGTFTYLAARQHFGHRANYHSMRATEEVFDAVERGRCDYGVVPIENSTGGTVGETLDNFVDSELLITSEVELRISHNLYSKSGKIGRIKRIYSHPQAVAQSWGWIRTNLLDVEIVEVSSTAEAARKAKGDPQGGAIAGKLAGETYGLIVVAERIEDYRHNFTRFLIIGRDKTEPTGSDRTSMLLSLKDEPGILFKALKPFADKGLNLSKIESRPLKHKAWEYLFFIDVDGHEKDATIQETIKKVAPLCLFIKVLGSYPRE